MQAQAGFSHNSMNSWIERLTEASVAQQWTPDALFSWPEKEALLLSVAETWSHAPEWTSLYGTSYWETLSPAKQKQLAFLEAVNFFSLNIHGERSLLEGLSKRLYTVSHTECTPYLHHFLDEENKHMTFLGTFCLRYHGKIYPSRRVFFQAEESSSQNAMTACLEDFLFFAKVLIFEELVDVMNRTLSLDERLHPLIRQIHAVHHKDEARHLVFGRHWVHFLLKQLKEKATPEVFEREHQPTLLKTLADYEQLCWKEYYNPDVYRDLGLTEPYQVMREAFVHPAQAQHRLTVAQACRSFFAQLGLAWQEEIS